MSRKNKHTFFPRYGGHCDPGYDYRLGGLWQPTHAAPGEFYYIEVDTAIDDNSLDDCTIAAELQPEGCHQLCQCHHCRVGLLSFLTGGHVLPDSPGRFR